MPSSRAEAGGQLLQELEALSKALHKAQSMGPSVEAEVPPPRRDFEGRSSHRRVSEVVGSRPTTTKPSRGGLESRHSISMINPAKIKAEDDDGKDKDTEFPEWLEDNLAFSQNLEAPLQKRSFWDWKPIRALSHIGQQRFHCEFSAHVHGIEKLPSSMNGLRLQVHLRHHKDTGLHTIPARAAHGSVEFEETLHFRCTVYGSKKSSGTIKYMAKSFTLFVAAPDVAELDLGKHRLDLSRILPSNTTTSGDGSNPSWNTSFKLSGKAKGSSLWITFGYEILDNNNKHLGNSSSSRFSPSPTSQNRALRSFNSLPNSPQTSMLRVRKASSVVDFGSPGPGNDFSDFRIEHLSLDDPEFNDDARGKVKPAATIPPRVKSNSVGEFDLRGRPLFPEIDYSLAPSTQGHTQEPDEEEHGEENNAEKDDDNLEEDDAVEFNVIEQGVETSPLSSISSTQDHQQQLEHPTVEDVGSMDDHSQSQQQQQEQEEASVHYQESHVENVEFEEEPESEQQPRASEVVDGHHIASGLVTHESEGLEVTTLKMQEEEQEVRPVVHPYEGPAEREDNEAIHGYDSQDGIQEPIEWKQSEVVGYDRKDGEAGDEWKNEDENDGMDLLEALENDALNEATEGQQEADVNSNKAYDDDEVELVEGEFLDMLEEPTAAATVDEDSDDEPDSPRALLFKQFEQEAMLEGGFGAELDNEELSKQQQEEQEEEQFVSSLNGEDGAWNSEEETELVAIMDAAESELQKATQAMRSKARAKMLEDAEAQALLHEWGLNENVFQNNGSDQGVDVSPTNALMILKHELPPLAPGLSTTVPTRDGGSLRSMNPVHFQGGKNEGRLVMHASKPVVVPTEKGSTALDVLRNLAAGGTESMAVEAMGAMPLEDITGKSVHQIAVEGQACLERRNQRYALEYGSGSSTGGSSGALASQSSTSLGLYPKQKKASIGQQQHDSFSLNELAPVAMEKIEALAMQGLKIQCEMAEDAAPYTIDPVSSQDRRKLKGRINAMEGLGGGMRLLQAPKGDESSESDAAAGDGLISMSLSLDEWMRLDAGLCDEEEETNDKTLAILDAHRAAHTTTDLVLNLDGENDKEGRQQSSGKMGNTLTLAMLVQLRDPLRNYEPVGAPMMALIEAERVVLPPRPKLWKRVAFKGNSEVDEEEEEMGSGGQLQQAQFKITAVHMAGLKPNEDAKDSNKKNVWCSQKQQQSGSRWLVANGMGKTGAAKHPLMKSKANRSGSKEKQGESLWSISSQISSSKDGGGMPVISRNPDVKFGKMRAGFKKPW